MTRFSQPHWTMAGFLSAYNIKLRSSELLNSGVSVPVNFYGCLGKNFPCCAFEYFPRLSLGIRIINTIYLYTLFEQCASGYKRAFFFLRRFSLRDFVVSERIAALLYKPHLHLQRGQYAFFETLRRRKQCCVFRGQDFLVYILLRRIVVEPLEEQHIIILFDSFSHRIKARLVVVE